MALSGMSGNANGNVVQTKRSIGTQTGTTEPVGPGGVVLRTKARNDSAYNPGGSSGTGVSAPNSVRTSSRGAAVVSTKGRTVAGTNKTIG